MLLDWVLAVGLVCVRGGFCQGTNDDRPSGMLELQSVIYPTNFISIHTTFEIFRRKIKICFRLVLLTKSLKIFCMHKLLAINWLIKSWPEFKISNSTRFYAPLTRDPSNDIKIFIFELKCVCSRILIVNGI